MLKTLLIAPPVAGVALYLAGVFDAAPYPRTVEGSPAQVMGELADLDIREQPGAPGSTAESAGGVAPTFRLVRGEGRLDWFVMSGSQVAMTMTATFEPVEGGARTRIGAWVQRGDAPDERTSPAFRSEGLTLGLFHAALDTELDEMTAIGWGPECDAIRDELLAEGALAKEGMAMEAAGSVGERIAAVGKAAKGLARIRGQLLARGCNPDASNPKAGADGFVQVRSTMGEGSVESPPSLDEWYGEDGDAPAEDAGWGDGQ